MNIKYAAPLQNEARKLRAPACLLIVLLILLSCNKGKTEVHPVERVIASMTDSLPRIPLPEDADPEDENWIGIDLEPKPPVLPLYPEEEQKKFLLPPGYSIEPVYPAINKFCAESIAIAWLSSKLLPPIKVAEERTERLLLNFAIKISPEPL